MSLTMRGLRRVLWGLLAVLLAGIVGTVVWTREGGLSRQGGWDQRPLEGLQVFGAVPDFTFIERSGRRVGLSDIRGKVWIANFIYTHCTETCPIQSAQVAQLQADLRDVPDVRFVSITVEPETDTPEVLAEYARRYGADPEKWLFLTGEKKAIYRLALEGFRLSVADPREGVQAPAQKGLPPAGSSSPQSLGSSVWWSALLWLLEPAPAMAVHGSPATVFIHSSRFALVDRQARIRGYYRSDDPEALQRIQKDVRSLVREKWRVRVEMLALWLPALLAVALRALVMAPPNAWAHKLPRFPQVRLLEAEPDQNHPLARFLTVQALDPAGRQPVTGAEVTAKARHAERGSAWRTEAIRLVPAREPGTYGGRLEFPRAGPWEVTIEVQGRYVGDAHFLVEVAAPTLVAAPGRRERGKPDLPIDWPTVRHLAMEWGHLLGFGLWVAATLVGLVRPDSARWGVVGGSWAAFVIEGVTGLYKMEYSTPFATPLQLFGLSRIPRIFFAEEYVYTLVIKHGLMLAGVVATGALTVHVWRTKPGDGVRAYRGLLGVNLVLSLLIAGAAAALGLYHAVVLHFS